MPQDKSSSAVAKGLKMTKFGSNSTNVQVTGTNNTSASNTAGSAGDRTGNQSIATSNTSGTSANCHHHYHHHYPPKHRRTGSGKTAFFEFTAFLKILINSFTLVLFLKMSPD